MADDVIIESEIRDIEKKIDSKVEAFHKELTERIDEIENLEMLLEAEMLQLKELVVGKTDIFFPKDLERRVSLIEEYIASMKETGNEEILKQIREMQEKIRSLGKSDVIGPEIKDAIAEINEKLAALREERKRIEFLLSKSDDLKKSASKVDSVIAAIEKRIEGLEKMLSSGGIDETVRKSLGLVADHDKKIGEIEGRLETLSELSEKLKSRLDGIEKDIGSIKKGLDYLTREEMEDIIIERLEGALSAEIPRLEEEIRKIRDDIEHLEAFSDPSNLVALNRKIEEDLEALGKRLDAIEKEIPGIRMARERVLEIEARLKDMSHAWEKAEEAIKDAEEAKNIALGLRDRLRAELEAAVIGRVEESSRALDHRISHLSNNVEKMMSEIDAIRQEVDTLSSEFPAIRQEMDFFKTIIRTTEEHEKKLDSVVEGFRKRLDEIKSEFDSFVDRRILMHLKGVADEMDRKMPEIASKEELKRVSERLDILEGAVKRIDLSGLKSALDNLYRRITELEEKIEKRRPAKSFPFMIE